MRSESDRNGIQKHVRILMRFLERGMQGSAAEAVASEGGGRLRPPFRYSSYSFLFSFLKLFNTPCSLAKDEVRRI